MNAVFHSSPSRIRTRLYALRRSSLEKMRGPTEFLERGQDQGKWIGKLNSLGIQNSIINAWPQAPVLLTHEEKAWCRWWTGWPDVTLIKSLLDVFLHSLALRDGQNYPWGVYIQAADQWHSPMADEVVTGWLPACWRHPGTPYNQMGSWESCWTQDSQPAWRRPERRVTWEVDVEFPWHSVDDTIRSSKLPHLTPIWSLESGVWARGS